MSIPNVIDRVAEKFGHRSLANNQWQSWGSFTMQLFGKDTIRGEFDRVDFIFSAEKGSDAKWEIIAEDIYDGSTESMYFGRPIERTKVTLEKLPDYNTTEECIENIFTRIQPLLPKVYGEEKSKLSQPQLVVECLEGKEDHVYILHSFYLWQYNNQQ